MLAGGGVVDVVVAVAFPSPGTPSLRHPSRLLPWDRRRWGREGACGMVVLGRTQRTHEIITAFLEATLGLANAAQAR